MMRLKEGLGLIIVICIAMIASMQITTYFDWPSVDILPLVQRLNNSHFLLNDLYTNSSAEFSVRTYFAYGLYFLSKLLTIEPSRVLAYLSPMATAGVAAGLYLLARGFKIPIVTIILAIGIIFFQILQQPIIGGWQFVADQAMTSWISLSIWLLVLAAGQRQWLILVCCLLVPATLVHFSTSLILFPFLLLIYYYGYQSSQTSKHLLRELLLISGLFVGTIGLGFLLPLSMIGNSSMSAELFYYVYVVIRHPHHYDLLSVSSQDWWTMCVYGIAWLVVLCIVRFWLRQKQLFWIGCIVFISGVLAIVAHYVFVNILHIHMMTVISPIRFVMLLWPIFIFLLTHSIVASLLQWQVLPQIAKKIKFVMLVFLSAGLLLYVLYLGHRFITTVNDAQQYLLTQNQSFYDCVQRIVPKNKSVFLHPQFDSIMFRLRAERAVYGSDVFTFNERFIPDWWQEYQTIYGDTSIGNISSVLINLQPSNLQEIYNQSGIHYYVLPQADNALGLQHCTTIEGYTLIEYVTN